VIISFDCFDIGIFLILGFANLFADGFSMAVGNYLGSKSQRGVYREGKKKGRMGN
jgi:vacuolar iron transporter family protein